MGTLTKRGDLQWQAKVRRKGFPQQSRTFMYKEDAEKWVRTVERELETSGFVDRREAEKNTLAEVLRRYRKDVTPRKKSAAIESVKIDVLLRDKALVELKMSAVTSAALAKWRDRRLQEVTGATVNREIDVLSTVLNHARREWGIHVENPVPYIKRPEKARSWDRRLSPDEERYLMAALTGGERREDGTFSKGARNLWLLPLVELALETAMRRGELSISAMGERRPRAPHRLSARYEKRGRTYGAAVDTGDPRLEGATVVYRRQNWRTSRRSRLCNDSDGAPQGIHSGYRKRPAAIRRRL